MFALGKRVQNRIARTAWRRLCAWKPKASSYCLPSLSLALPTQPVSRRLFSSDHSFGYRCSKCGKEYTKWQGQCHACNAWNTIEHNSAPSVSAPSKAYSSSSVKVVKPSKLRDINPVAHSRYKLSGAELNRVFGGGIVPGSLTLVGGEPGIGKSSLLLKVSSDICKCDSRSVLYISGEESEDQVKLRCDRLGIRDANLLLLHETNLDAILKLVYTNVVPCCVPSCAALSLFVHCDRLHSNGRNAGHPVSSRFRHAGAHLHIASPGVGQIPEHHRVRYRTCYKERRLGGTAYS